ncbi:hypothetical protein J1605_007527 [Eschrichtius robustus]|uniref:Transmembrane protein 71 n=1 Tax=Eschrichtius robustus TaxID=9764 RepID=A0AB34H1M4_ESCRO|nr:hypothetical protein J1605_007527 [Eschrichtius robustus]
MESVSHSRATEGIVLIPSSFLTRAVEWKVMPFDGTQNPRGGWGDELAQKSNPPVTVMYPAGLIHPPPLVQETAFIFTMFLSVNAADMSPTGSVFSHSLFSFACDFLDGDSSFECCTIDPLTGSHFTCRRSPRLLTNGYYIWTEDSFLCDKDGNITLSPSQTSVLYKENLVNASESWLHGNIFSNADSSPSEDVWLEGVRRLETNHCHENGGGFDCSLTDNWESEKLTAESVKTSFSSHVTSRSPGENSHNLPPQSQFTASEHFQENILDHPNKNTQVLTGQSYDHGSRLTLLSC